MIMLVDMSVRWGPDLDMLMKGLMVVMLVAHIKLAHLVMSQLISNYAFNLLFFGDYD